MARINNTIDFDVLKKFNQQGPRYTSYPTAPLFSPEFTGGDYTREIVETNKAADGAADLALFSLSVLCEKLCFFCGCNMRVTHDRSLIHQYNEYLKERDRPASAGDRR